VPCYAIEALAKIGDTRAVEPLIMSLKTTYTERYLEYLQSSKTYLDYLDMLDHNMIGMLLKGKLRKWPSFFRDRVRFKHPQLATIWALGEMGDKSAVKPLIKTFESENLDQIKVAAKAIVKIKENDIGDEKENIMKFLESDDQGMVRMGASMLKGILEE
jgi:HEAT repeat protein